MVFTHDRLDAFADVAIAMTALIKPFFEWQSMLMPVSPAPQTVLLLGIAPVKSCAPLRGLSCVPGR